MFSIDWNAVINSTSATLRAAVIIVVLGLLVMATTVISLAIWNGRAFKGFGIDLAEYRDPDALRCEALIKAFPETSAVNADALQLRDKQISELLKLSKDHLDAAYKMIEASRYTVTPNTISQYFESAKDAIDKATKLRVDQQEIIMSRDKALQNLFENCKPRSR